MQVIWFFAVAEFLINIEQLKTFFIGLKQQITSLIHFRRIHAICHMEV